MHNFNSDDELKRPIIERFIKKITHGTKERIERFYEIFSARGFSLEFDKHCVKVRLSGDSHKEDGEFLEALQNVDYKKRYNKLHQDAIDKHDCKDSNKATHIYFDHIGTQLFEIDNAKYLTEIFTHTIPIDLFRLNWERARFGEFEQFKTVEQFPPIRVYDLEPFIARLIKSISSIGISTWSSCEGHWDSPAYIVFDGKYHSTWFQAIFNTVIKKRLNTLCNWEWLGERCSIGSPKGDYLELYLEIQAAARLIYDNRVLLRDTKKQVCPLLTNKHKGMNKKALLKVFEEGFEEATNKIR
ncbi:MAG: hypothetical protein A2Z57_01115 [Planctomycetes bacterium RIFCSPHIGHO2_12_39_6]|nr:MAG: hypothetical protein A2Z57_01115 [Planctomycetes bacterium RIFCSPHIGHO2_12_39_6]OHB96884.1 MAG: hypothetical protein A2W74_04920 [Planctomycetes bacterium RIFCSPLOWO2_12_38_17]